VSEKNEILRLLEKKRDLLAKVVEATQYRFKAGIVSDLVVLEAEIRLCDAEIELARI
jgi:outer membrane protein TolC